MKRIHLRTILIVLIFLAILIFQYTLSHNENFLTFYIRHIFQPLQRLRSNLLNGLPFSLGDLTYLLLALGLLLLLTRIVYFLFTARRNHQELLTELQRLGLTCLSVYFIFLVFWGGNYSRRPLSAAWETGSLPWDKPALILLTEGLIDSMNKEQQLTLRYPDLKELNRQANRLYHERFGDRLANLLVKPTSLGYMLNYIGIQGYYNPLSGEAQFNRFIPAFMHPFVVCHEMAHQAGIAAEDDANLLAYILGSESQTPAFRYSAFFNLFLYAYADLKARDTTAAAHAFARLNQQSRNDLDSLSAMHRRYRSSFRHITSSMYDEYLRLHGQREGIHTYNDVSRWVYLRQHSANKRADLTVCP